LCCLAALAHAMALRGRPTHSLSTIDAVFNAVYAAARQLRPVLLNISNFAGVLCAGIKENLLSPSAVSGGDPGRYSDEAAVAAAEAELLSALRSALAFLDGAYVDAGPMLFLQPASLGYELTEVVRGLQHAARKAYAAGLLARDPTAGADASPVTAWLMSIEARLRGDVSRLAHLLMSDQGDPSAMMAAAQQYPLAMNVLNAVSKADVPPDLLYRRLEDTDTSRHLFELHYDDVDFEMVQVKKKGQVYKEKILIGQSRYGPVYKGRFLGVPVVVKELLSATASIFDTFEQEVAMLCALRHPNIVPLVGFTRGDRAEDTQYALVTPLLVKGFTDATADRSYSVQARLRWCVDIACALVYLHGREPSVPHGDLSPAKVTLDTAGNAVLLDFGLAAASRTAQLHVRNDPLMYGAPEVQAGGAPSAAADVFAFGLVMYEIWHGRPWFEGILLREHCVGFLRAGHAPPLDLHAVPPFAASLIAQCLATNPGDRPSSAEVLQKIRTRTEAAARRADNIIEGDATSFSPLPDGQSPPRSGSVRTAASNGESPAPQRPEGAASPGRSAEGRRA
jgi:serine/threonine protein kinase